MTIKLGKVFGLFLMLFLGTVGASSVFGQATGNIVGTVVDASGATVAGVTVTVSNSQLGVARTVNTGETGTYSVPSLLPADYDVTAEMQGFKKTVKHVTLSAGSDLTADLALVVGETNQSVSVEAQAVNVDLVNSKVDADVSPTELTELPLIGRSAFEMAKLTPGVTVTASPGRNSDVSVYIVGRTFTDTRVSVDGLDISNFVSGAEPEMNFQQDIIQEFQVSINNGDPSNGVSTSGTLNLVTRRGTNDIHGSGYGYFRNSQYAAFPGISHPAVVPNPTNNPAITDLNETNASPNFFRRQIGGIIGGPIKKDRLYWLGAVEDTDQQAAGVYYPGFGALNNAFSSVALVPKNRWLASFRFDWQASDKDSLFLFVASDRLTSRTFAGAQPTDDGITDNYADIGILGWTRVFSNHFVGDFRFGFDWFNLNAHEPPETFALAQQFAPNSGLQTLGNITINGTNMIFGGRTDEPQALWTPRPQATANFTYTKGTNTWKFGFIGEPTKGKWWRNWYQPMQATAYNPTQVATYNASAAPAAQITIPTTFNTIADVLQLPLNTVSMGIGNDATYPFKYGAKDVLWSQIYQAYVGSSYKAKPTLTLNWAIVYNYDGIAPNRDLPLPESLAPFVGGNLRGPQNEKHDFAPSVGFAWDPTGHGKTVIRGGSGYYFGNEAYADPALSRASLLPAGDGNTIIPGTYLTNPLTNGTGNLIYTTLANNVANNNMTTGGVFRLQDMVNNLAGIRSNLLNTVFTDANTNLLQTNFDYFKGNTYGINVPNFRMPTIVENMVGVQQQVSADWLFTFTAIYNVTNHMAFTYDANQSQRAAAYGGRVVPALGAVTLMDSGGHAVYNAQIVTAKKTISRHYSIDAAFTHAISNGTISEVFIPGSLIDLTNRADNYGPEPTTPDLLFTIGATAMALPGGFEVSFINVMQGKLPFNPYLAGLDLNGDGTPNDHLPEIGWDQVNRKCSVTCLKNAVADFDQNWASIPGPTPGTFTTTRHDTLGNVINPITLPAKFATGHSLITQDIRVTKNIHLHENFNIHLAAEMFNMLNLANLEYAASAQNLYSTGFGQPTDRTATYFGTGSPRAMQFSARLIF